MSELDRLIYSLALRDAEYRIQGGYRPEEAAELATPGAWSEFRPLIVNALKACEDRDGA